MRGRVRRLGILGVCIAALSCGSAPEPAVQRRPATHTVTMEAVGFAPANLEAVVGDSVVWVNKDPFPHTSTAAGGAFDSKAIDAGASWTYTFDKPGEYPYACTLHPTMKGTLRVK